MPRPDCVTRPFRALHLRTGLNLFHGADIGLTPMFGLEVNTGRGPDRLKFFTGGVIKLKSVREGVGQIPSNGSQSGQSPEEK